MKLAIEVAKRMKKLITVRLRNIITATLKSHTIIPEREIKWPWWWPLTMWLGRPVFRERVLDPDGPRFRRFVAASVFRGTTLYCITGGVFVFLVSESTRLNRVAVTMWVYDGTTFQSHHVCL